jgi:hydroxyethylthiazole kinase-like uncharacterized protein yjeF
MDDARHWGSDDAQQALRLPTAGDDKYSRGVVGLRTGSEAYPGAAVLGVEAAWRAGTGMVRYVGPAVAAGLVLQRRPETVTADGRVQAWVIGSGTDAAHRGDDEERALRRILAGEVPVVVDAGALDLVGAGRGPRVVTPHARELARMREAAGLVPLAPDADDDAREAAAAQTAARLGVVVLLKGSTTIVATPEGWMRRVTAGTPWLATAGTGDVLGGVVGAVVAGGQAAAEADGGSLDAESLGPLVATAAWLHARAASDAASALGAAGGPLTALDVADALPRVVAGVVAPR